MSEKLNIVVLGGGESGVGAALLAQRKGHSIFLSDGGNLKSEYKSTLKKEAIHYEENQHSIDKILQADLVIKSPGIPDSIALIQHIKKADIQIISEVEWAYRYCPGKIIAITGSNGKTTTTLLTYEILKNAGLSVSLVGNIGKSFAAAVNDDPDHYYALEVSSFQLDDTKDFKPHIAIITNITPDHLDRYENRMELYVKSKFSIAQNQDEKDFLIINQDDAESTKYLSTNSVNSQLLPISIKHTLEKGAWVNSNNNTIILNNQEAMNINELALQGKHNTYNSMASGLASKLLGIRKETIRESLAGFDNIEHRLEAVLQIYGIEFINDSKATNVNSTWYALESMQKPTIWIVGGIDKGNDYSQLYPLVKEKVKAIICLGKDNAKLHSELEDKVPFMIDTQDMNEAVRIAYKLGDKGDSVLLSPACASFDLFEDYEDRGRQFKNAVRGL